MSYLIQSKMAQDYGLIMRIAACAASEGVVDRPESWADNNRQRIVAAPGWAAAWASAVAAEDDNPGENEAVITDGMILAAVQPIIEAEVIPPEPLPEPAE